MSSLGWVCLGGALGSGARYLVAVGLARWGAGFPWGTLTVNLLGSFLLAALLGTADVAGLRSELRLMLGTGMMGGFTTYSTFNLEALRMLERGDGSAAAFYVALTMVGALVAGYAGWVTGRWAFAS